MATTRDGELVVASTFEERVADIIDVYARVTRAARRERAQRELFAAGRDRAAIA